MSRSYQDDLTPEDYERAERIAEWLAQCPTDDAALNRDTEPRDDIAPTGWVHDRETETEALAAIARLTLHELRHVTTEDDDGSTAIVHTLITEIERRAVGNLLLAHEQPPF